MSARTRKPRTKPRLPSSHRVADTLRWLILSGELPEGIALREIELAQRLRVSRIPLREALRSLQSQRLVTLTPFQGAVVPMLDPTEARELIELRQQLDPGGYIRALPNLDPQILAKAEQLVRARAARSQPVDWADIDEQFLDLIMGAAEQAVVRDTVTLLHHRLSRYYRLFDPTSIAVNGTVHMAILDALRRQDEAALRQVIADLYTRCQQELLDRISSHRASAPMPPAASPRSRARRNYGRPRGSLRSDGSADTPAGNEDVTAGDRRAFANGPVASALTASPHANGPLEDSSGEVSIARGHTMPTGNNSSDEIALSTQGEQAARGSQSGRGSEPSDMPTTNRLATLTATDAANA